MQCVFGMSFGLLRLPPKECKKGGLPVPEMTPNTSLWRAFSMQLLGF